MQVVTLPTLGTARAWRDAARGYLNAGVAPEELRWHCGAEGEEGLFDVPATPDSPAQIRRNRTVPRSFISLSDSVCWHSDPARFDRLYAFLWRLIERPSLMSDRGDPQLARLRRMEKSVHRCQHKMKAFVRFREIGAPSEARRSFAAWFEPEHHTLEPTAPFFARRFGDMDWRILTPGVSAIFENGSLRFEPGQPRPGLPEDASEALWLTYFRNIFNPARLKVKAMQSEMPKKYWRNMPETAAIPELIASAPARARAMAAAAPSLPPARMARVQAAADAQAASHWQGAGSEMATALSGCIRCPLHQSATQPVAGEGPAEADLMLVGEQPGDQEDLAGRPFVGPAGQVLADAMAEAGLAREAVYLTNAVKHFKFKPRGRRRLHQRPNAGEVQACRWWLDAEIARVRPRLIVALGATAAAALTGKGEGLMQRRGRVEAGLQGVAVLPTLHPAHVLRTPGTQDRRRLQDLLRADLILAQRYLDTVELPADL